MKPDMTLAVAYARVSTEDQRLGVEAQAAANAAYASAHGLRVVASFTDQGVSGASDLADRPGLMEALEAMRREGAGVLLVAKRDRLARDVFVAMLLERELAAFGAQVQCAEGGNEDSPEGLLFRRMLDVFAEFERSKIRARTRAALRAKKARGEAYCGSVPYGMRRVGDAIVPEPREQEAIALVQQWNMERASFRLPLSLSRMARRLWAAGFKPRKGERFAPEQIRRMLRGAA